MRSSVKPGKEAMVMAAFLMKTYLQQVKGFWPPVVVVVVVVVVVLVAVC